MSEKGLLIVLSAPSGCGKSTIVHKLLERRKNLRFSISATTRAPREGEADGRDYFFVTRDRFMEMIAADEFLEYAEYVGNFYGTPLPPIQRELDAGYDVLLEIETKGAFQVKEKCPDCMMVFLLPPSFEDLEKRLIARGKDSMEVIAHRLEVARLECLLAEKYDYTIVNDVVERAVGELDALIDSVKQSR